MCLCVQERERERERKKEAHPCVHKICARLPMYFLSHTFEEAGEKRRKKRESTSNLPTFLTPLDL